MTQKGLDKDREQWFSFLSRFKEQAEKQNIRALMLTPYGEALIYAWYWEGLAQVSALPWVDAAGAQTNLGFEAAGSMRVFAENGGVFKKLRLWATFHPEMTTVQAFVKSCRKLRETGIQISAGAVGVPEHAGLLQQLRKELPKDIYMWVNRMDGLGRAYTTEEIQVFSSIDPYFYRELQPHPADVSQCRGRYFAEGDGRLRLCNISPVLETGACSRKRCSCYLAYGGRENLVNRMLFGPWPLFRIPRRPKAVFLDIEGTLLPPKGWRDGSYAKAQTESQRCRDVSKDIQAALEVLAKREGTLLFFATTLPYEDARKRCRSVWHLFSGGVFAGGAHVLSDPAENAAGLYGQEGRKDRKEVYYFLDEEVVGYLELFRQMPHGRMLVYRDAAGHAYKITLLHGYQRPWARQEAEEVMAYLPAPAREQVRYLLEGYCMQIIAAGAGKAAGVRMVCNWLQISLKEIFAAGDSEEDAEMLHLLQSS